MSYHYDIDFERHNLYDLCFYVTSSLILPGGEFHTTQYLFGHHSRPTAAQTIQNNMCAKQYIPFMTKSTGSQVIHQHLYYIHHEHQSNCSRSDRHKGILDKINRWIFHIPVSQVTFVTKLIVQQTVLAASYSWCQQQIP
jgi:hypothetical protein